MRRVSTTVTAFGLACLACSTLCSPLASAAPGDPNILIYTRTAGYRHDSLPTAQDAIRNMSTSSTSSPIRFNPVYSEDPAYFTMENLRQLKAIMFLSNSDEILDSNGKAALYQYWESGGNLLIVHAGSAALFTTPFFGTAIGAFFDYHATFQPATFTVINASHPSTSMLPSRWSFSEEVYFFRSAPLSTNTTLLLSVDPTSFDNTGGTSTSPTGSYYQGDPHPIAWYRDNGLQLDLGNNTGSNGLNLTGTSGASLQDAKWNGRMWHTSLGHSNATWQDPTFLQHISGGIQWILQSTTSPSNSSSTSASSTSPPTNSPTSSVISSSPVSSSPTPSSRSSACGRTSEMSIFALLASLLAAATLP